MILQYYLAKIEEEGKSKFISLFISLLFFLHYLQIIFLHLSTLQWRNKSKLNYTSREKQNVRSDQISLSFRVGHCHRQLIGMPEHVHNRKKV